MSWIEARKLSQDLSCLLFRTKETKSLSLEWVEINEPIVKIYLLECLDPVYILRLGLNTIYISDTTKKISVN